MKARVIVFVAIGLALVLIVIGWRSARAADEAERQLPEAAARRASLRVALQRLTQAAKESPNSAPVLTSSRDQAAVAAKSPAVPPRTRPPGLTDLARDNPQLWNEFIQSKRAELGRWFLPLMLRLQLTPEQRERFKDIIAADIARGSDIGAAAKAQGLRFDDPTIAALRKQAEEQRDKELTELLGAEGFRRYDEFERVTPLRGFIDGLAVQLANTTPLSAAQADAMERALAESNPPYREGKRAEPRQVDWAEADRRIREILSPDQFAVWALGTAHNPLGGSRRDQELTAVYERAVKRMKEAAAGSEPDVRAVTARTAP